MKKLTVLIVVGLLLSIIIFSNYNSVAAESYENLINQMQEEKINELYIERFKAIKEGDKERENELNLQLESYGVEEISLEDFYRITNTPMPKYIVDSENYYLNVISQDIRENGKEFTCRIINATPKNQYCNLYRSGGITISNPNKLVIGLTSLVSTAKSIVLGQMNYTSIGDTIFEAVKDYFTEIKTTNVVSNLDMVYSWNVTEMCSFVYLALNTGAYTLIGHYNMGSYYIGTIINSMEFEDGIPVSDGIYNEYKGDFEAENYGSGTKALQAYLDGGMLYNMLSSFSIFGLEGKKLTTVELLNPYSPGEIK